MHSMRTVGVLFALLVAACSQAPSRPDVSGIFGLWQFPERLVWIEINPDMSAFQCRIARSNIVISSWGELVGSSTINWEENWGPDVVQATTHTLTIERPSGISEYQKAASPMAQACIAARRRSSE